MIDDVRQGSEAMPHQHPEEWVRDIILHPATLLPNFPPFRTFSCHFSHLQFGFELRKERKQHFNRNEK